MLNILIMAINLDKIHNQYCLFENYVINLYNIHFNDESLKRFLENVNNNFINTMITNIITTQEINENQKKLLKETFINWKYHIIEDPKNPFQKKIITI